MVCVQRLKVDLEVYFFLYFVIFQAHPHALSGGCLRVCFCVCVCFEFCAETGEDNKRKPNFF